ncbi:MAG: hypothetical protein AB9897_00950 [Anaerolineaceae bacterium]
MKRIQTHCEACGAPLPPQYTSGIKVCRYCGAIYKDEDWVEPSSHINANSPLASPTSMPEIPVSVLNESEKETRPTRKGLLIFIILICLGLFGCMTSLLIGRQNGNKQTLSNLAQNAAQAKPVMLNSLPTASYAGEAIAYANWEISANPSVQVSNGKIFLEMTLQNWNSTNQTIRFKANDFILYDDVGNKYPISMEGCADDAGFLDHQVSFDAYEKNDLSSSNSWCGNQGILPVFTGIIPGTAKHLYLQLTNFGVFSKITIVYRL